MGFSCCDEDPKILQLHKWSSTERQLLENLSEYREGFISPSKEFLLLHAYKSEALLIPLATAQIRNSRDPETCNLGNSGLSKPADTGSNLFSSRERDSKEASTSERSFSSDRCCFVSGVNSVVWGVCQDEVCNQHRDILFSEMLFVVGNGVVTVHSFVKSSESIRQVEEGNNGRGMWVDWGPSSDVSLQKGDQEDIDVGFEQFEDVYIARRTYERDSSHCNSSEDVQKTIPSRDATKSWLHTFLSKAETVKSDGRLYSKFPERSTFPSSAKIVSFKVFDGSLLLDLLSHVNPGLHETETTSRSNLDFVYSDYSTPSTNPLRMAANDGGTKVSCNCFRVFSSDTHHLVGFAIELMEPLPYRRKGNIVVAVAKIVGWAMQWVSLVWPDEISDKGEWTDFKLSDTLLICLKASGMVSLYDLLGGGCMQSVDLSIVCCLVNHLKSFNERESDDSDVQYKKHVIHNGENNLPGDVAGSCACNRRFMRLIMASHCSLLGVIDEFGLIYLMSVDDHTPAKLDYFTKSFPCYRQLGNGIFIGLEAGGAGIDRQMVLSDSSEGQNAGKICNSSTTLSSPASILCEELHHSQKSGRRQHISPFGLDIGGISSAAFAQRKTLLSSELPSHFMRRVFLPAHRSNANDVLCFSPFGITRLLRNSNSEKNCMYQIVHSNLFVNFAVNDDTSFVKNGWEACVDEAIGCTFHGCLYLVTKDGLSVVLPAVALSTGCFPVEALGYRPFSLSCRMEPQAVDILDVERFVNHRPPWKLEVLDKVLSLESPEEGDRLCLDNGLGLRISRIRRLQLALYCLKFEEIENSLQMLADMNLAEEGILRLIFGAVYMMLQINKDVISALRLLTIAASFAKTGLSRQSDDAPESWSFTEIPNYSFPSQAMDSVDLEFSKRMSGMADFHGIIRKLQLQLGIKLKDPAHCLVEGENTSVMLEDHTVVPVLPSDIGTSQDCINSPPETRSGDVGNRAWMPMETSNREASSLVSTESGYWEPISLIKTLSSIFQYSGSFKLEGKSIAKDALLSGCLHLADAKLRFRSRHSVPEQNGGAFVEVSDLASAVIYKLIVKGETALAVTSLQIFGEDIELTLKTLLFGTFVKSFRPQIAELLIFFGYLGVQEWKVLKCLSLIERVYPLSSFHNALCARMPELKRESNHNKSVEVKMHLVHPLYKDLIMDCGEVGGVVFGLSAHVLGHSVPPDVEEDNVDGGYWTAAAIWSDAWDQTIIDRVVLDQPSFAGVDVSWESRLEYSISHNDWLEVSKLLEVIPLHAVCSGNLNIKLDSAWYASAVRGGQDIPMNENYTYSIDDLEAVCLSVPNITISRFSSHNLCSLWLKTLMEQKLAEKLIFLKDQWEGTSEVVPLLARSGFMRNILSTTLVLQDSSESSSNFVPSTIDGMQANAVLFFHKLVVHYCAQNNLLILLDLYLDYHKLALDHDSFSFFQDAAGNNQWAMWLLLLRVKGKEYEASFYNARAVASCNAVPGSDLSLPENDNMIRSVDDVAERAGELAALATLMFSPIRAEECLNSGDNNRPCSSAQCTLENLLPALQHFPTLGGCLRAACLGHDPTTYKSMPKPRVHAYSDFLDYLNWRETIFFSCSRDTSLLQMLPCWFPKAVRRLVQLYVQGPLGWQSLADFSGKELSQLSKYDNGAHSEVQSPITALSWEAIIQRHVEVELYASSLGAHDVGLEYHLYRGHAMAAFSYFLASRVETSKMSNAHTETSGSSVHLNQNVQSDSLALLAPIRQSEESLISKVMFLAITHFENSVLVASCATLLELCGLSASILQVDIAALRRISSFYRSPEYEAHLKSSPRGFIINVTSTEEGDIAEALSRTLADHYVLHGFSSCLMQSDLQNSIPSIQPPSVLLLFVHHLENACLPFCVDGITCGSWLATGKGDGAELRAQQKAASLKWNLVTTFSQIHQMPLSTKYLAYLARDNDWVGFLSEAQLGGYPLETVIEIASKEFSNLPLKIHLLTVLKSMLSKEQVGSASNPDTAGKQDETSIPDGNLYASVELFEIIAECEKLKNPGKVLLLKAKHLRWPILVMSASCFPDVSPLSCLAVWLEIVAARETSAIKSNDVASLVANNVGSAVEATNSVPLDESDRRFHYDRRNPKRRRLLESTPAVYSSLAAVNLPTSQFGHVTAKEQVERIIEDLELFSEEASQSLPRISAELCEQHSFLPLLRAFEIFLPSSSLLPFICSLQAFSQMRLSDASAHMQSFSARILEENSHAHTSSAREGPVGKSLMCSIAVKAADAVLSTCPSPYEKRCLLQLLADANFGDGGAAATHYRQLFCKINLAEPYLRKDSDLHIGTENLDDASLLEELIKNACWEQARTWSRQLEACGGTGKSAADYITEMQAESMVLEWKEFLWDVPEERMALWGHCQSLFVRYSFPASQAGSFFLKHAEASEKDLPAGELHELLLLSLQWLSGIITQSNPVSPLNFLREIETKVWLLAIETDSQQKSEGESWLSNFSQEPGSVKSSSILDHTTTIISKMDNHINSRIGTSERSDLRENIQTRLKTPQVPDSFPSEVKEGSSRTRRKAKGFLSSRRSSVRALNKNIESECLIHPDNLGDDLSVVDKEDNFKSEGSFPMLEERPADAEAAILSLLEFGQVAAARQLRNKLSQGHVADELVVIDAAMKLAAISTPNSKVSASMLDGDLRSVLDSHDLLDESRVIEPLQVLESLAACIVEGVGSALCKRIIAVVKGANVLGLSFEEAFDKQPIELLQLLTLKAQDSFEEANLLVQAHSMPASSIAQVLAESFLKGLLAAHRGGYMDFQKEEGPSPLLWRFSDFLKWAELCPSEPQIGHSLMRLVITGQEVPNACEVELLILAHHFYKSSARLDGVDVLVALAGTRVEAYIAEGDFACLARLITGVGNFHSLKFILDILIENGQLDLLLHKYSAAAHSNAGTAETVRGFRMAVLTSLQQFNPNDIDAFSMVYNHFDMKHEAAALLESRAKESSHNWFMSHYKDHTDDLLESMRYFIEAAEVYSSIDAGNKTRKACAQASLVSLQIRMPDLQWLNLSETNARRVLVEQSCFQEALIVAEAYGLNQPSEWALVLWNRMMTPESTEQFLSEFEAVLPLHPSMLVELAKFYRAEVAARGDQSNFSVWLSGGGLPSEWAKTRCKSFKCLFKRTRDIGLRLRLATLATGFEPIVENCNRDLDKVPENAGPLVLKKGHGGAYLPLM